MKKGLFLLPVLFLVSCDSSTDQAAMDFSDEAIPEHDSEGLSSPKERPVETVAGSGAPATGKQSAKVAGQKLREAAAAGMNAAAQTYREVERDTRDAREAAVRAARSAAEKAGGMVREYGPDAVEWAKESAAKGAEALKEEIGKLSEEVTPQAKRALEALADEIKTQSKSGMEDVLSQIDKLKNSIPPDALEKGAEKAKSAGAEIWDYLRDKASDAMDDGGKKL